MQPIFSSIRRFIGGCIDRHRETVSAHPPRASLGVTCQGMPSRLNRGIRHVSNACIPSKLSSSLGSRPSAHASAHESKTKNHPYGLIGLTNASFSRDTASSSDRAEARRALRSPSEAVASIRSRNTLSEREQASRRALTRCRSPISCVLLDTSIQVRTAKQGGFPPVCRCMLSSVLEAMGPGVLWCDGKHRGETNGHRASIT